MAPRKSLLTLLVLVSLSGAAAAGPVLDEILNYTFMDQTVPMKGPEDLWIAERSFALSKDQPVGQTFVTGPDTGEIARIRACVAANEDWDRGEGVEMVVWDSPEKKVSRGRYTIWYEFRGYHYNHTDFEVNAKVQPNTSYYLELSYVGKGDGKVGRIGVMNGPDNYKSGQGYLAGKETDFDLCFQVHSRRPLDRIANLKKAFARFDLNRPRLAHIKASVDREDFDKAVADTVAYFEARQEPVAAIRESDKPVYDPSYDTARGDFAMQNYFIASDGGEGYVGPNLNWRADVSFDEKGNKIAGDFDLNRYGARGALVTPYLKTGNEKYARKFNDMMVDWFLDNPPPTESHIGGQPWDTVWASLQTGIRLGHGFSAYSTAHASPYFTTDCRFAWILDLADHADTLVLVGKDAGGNWAFTQNGSLLTFSLDYPEFTNSKLWFDTAAERTAGALKDSYLPDGVEVESAPGYQRFAYRPVADIMDLMQERKVKAVFSTGLKSQLEKQAEYFMYMAMPNGIMPFLGDWGADQARDSILKDSKRYNRSDMLFVATAGKEGSKPKELSKLYPYAGIVTMRSDWGDARRPYEDGRYLMLHGVHFGAHGHQDINGITLYAHGRELLADPGSYIYSSPEHRLLTTSPSHNLMTIDGDDQNRQGETRFDNWSTTPVADYLSSYADVYNGGAHNREVFYIRSNGDAASDYWIVRDTARGQGTHSLEQRWHWTLDSPVKADKSTLTVSTAFPDKGNLAIVQVTPTRLQLEETTTNTWHPRGTKNPPKLMPTSIYKANTALPAAIDTALFPFEANQSPPRLTTLESRPDGLDSAFKVVQGGVEDLFILQQTAQSKSIEREMVSFDGLRLFLRKVGGKLRSALLVNGSSLTVGGKRIIKSAKPLQWVAVSFEPAGTRVYTSSPEPSLTIPAAKGKVTIANMGMEASLRPMGAPPARRAGEGRK